MTIRNQKYFQPITIFTAMLISLFSFRAIKVFSLAVLIATFISAIIMAINIYKDDKHDKAKNSLIEFLYALSIFLIMRYLPQYITYFYSGILVIPYLVTSVLKSSKIGYNCNERR
jgi:hypothetical protein